MRQLISGLQFIHSLNISHRDLKVENILVDPNTFQTKIIDFGFAVKADSYDQKQTAFCGTASYMSPQIAANKPYVGPSSDIWAAGIILYEIIIGKQPFAASNESDLLKKIVACNIQFP
jgi:serine/threonine-protein kinase HSL1 (negative regulator of Swe1 kinase)